MQNSRQPLHLYIFSNSRQNSNHLSF
uniref:Uncharacterized protein n=1 Tax=Arundo donax TaxID=35708 RepID=A0A0A8YFC9_ARUDO